MRMLSRHLFLTLFLLAGLTLALDAEAKTVKTVTAAKVPPAEAASETQPVEATDASEPSEVILAIKNRAQRNFWEGKRPYPEQMQNANASAPLALTPTDKTLKRVSYSELSGVTFSDQPLLMAESEAFRRSLDTVGFELGMPCREGVREYLGWPLQQTEQERVNRIFEETNDKFKVRGYTLLPRSPRSVGADVSVFTIARPEKQVLGIWSAGDTGLLLLLCETQVNPTTSKAITAKSVTKKAKKKTPAKKKTSKKKLNTTSAPSSSMGAPASTVTTTTTTTTTAPAAPPTPALTPAVPAAANVAEPPKPEVIPGTAKAPDAAAPAAVFQPAPEPATPPPPGAAPTAGPGSETVLPPPAAVTPAEPPAVEPAKTEEKKTEEKPVEMKPTTPAATTPATPTPQPTPAAQ
jgi:hypothetical protein